MARKVMPLPPRSSISYERSKTLIALGLSLSAKGEPTPEGSARDTVACGQAGRLAGRQLAGKKISIQGHGGFLNIGNEVAFDFHKDLLAAYKLGTLIVEDHCRTV